MEGSASDTAKQAVESLESAAQSFVDEAQAVANAGVDTGQEILSDLVHAAISAIETALNGVKTLVSKT